MRYETVPLDKIKIQEGRQRTEFPNIPQLALSIKKEGQLVPVILDKDYTLIAGERRMRAIKLLERTEIDAVIYTEDVDIIKAETAQLEENIQREDLTWQEDIAAKLRLTRLKEKQATDKGESWSLRKTAETINAAIGTISQDVNLAEAIESFPELKDFKTKGESFNAFKKLIERAAEASLVKQVKEEIDGEVGEAGDRKEGKGKRSYC